MNQIYNQAEYLSFVAYSDWGSLRGLAGVDYLIDPGHGAFKCHF